MTPKHPAWAKHALSDIQYLSDLLTKQKRSIPPDVVRYVASVKTNLNHALLVNNFSEITWHRVWNAVHALAELTDGRVKTK